MPNLVHMDIGHAILALLPLKSVVNVLAHSEGLHQTIRCVGSVALDLSHSPGFKVQVHHCANVLIFHE